MRRSWVSVSVLILSCAFGVTPSAGTSSVTVATIDVPGATATFAHWINSTGQIVGDFADADRNFHGYLRTSGGTFATIDPPGAVETQARGINDAGQIVGDFTDAAGRDHGYLRASEGNLYHVRCAGRDGDLRLRDQ